MIDPDRLKELIDLMVDNDLAELDLRDGEEKVTIKRGGYGAAPPQISHNPAAPAGAVGDRAHPAQPVSAETEPAGEDGLVAIESPMVGTFYTSPNPDSPAFVSVGSSVGPDTVVCLIEAMKVFNEVKAETNGVIERILVQSGEAVEFGQKLFLVRPA